MSGNTQESRLDGIFSKGVTRSEFDSFMKDTKQDLDQIHAACFARIEEVREELHTRMNRQGNGFNERLKKHALSLMDKTDAINALSRRLSTAEHYLAHPELSEPSYSMDDDSEENEGQEGDEEIPADEQEDDEEISDIEPADEQGEEEQEIISPSSSSGSESSSTSDSGDSESDQSDEETQDYYSRRYRNAEENGPEY
jgi:hypothetical protein